MRSWIWFALVVPIIAVPSWNGASVQKNTVRLRGEIVDAASGARLPARIYLQGADGTWHFPASGGGSAVTYKKRRRDNPKCVEMHTTLSAHPFTIDLPPGKYTVTVERGKEYLPLVREIVVKDTAIEVKLPLKRWINLAERGWYSGETHVHRTLEELPNVMLAEDLNVAFPLSAWVREAFAAPRDPIPDKNAKLISVDGTHVIHPRNTEYEIFTIGKQPHTLGAFFIINHKTAFDRGVPPVKPIGMKARAEGALLDLDKPNWPWSMILAALLRIDLYELANNHVWRTEFGFPAFGDKPGAYMKIERDLTGFTERGWIDFGFQNYYALLNCGFRMRPTAGTASGVHPVPLGFGRVYVHQPRGFAYDTWVRGLERGNSFVTTGPMLFVKMDGKDAGTTFQADAGREFRIEGSAVAAMPLERIEIVVNGELTRTLHATNRRNKDGAFESVIDEKVKFPESGWLIVRCYEDRPDKRVRFAHTSPFHIDVPGKPVRPRRAESDFLLKRVTNELARSEKILPPAALQEYREALRIYQEIAKSAR
jgi:hypothetical protein